MNNKVKYPERNLFTYHEIYLLVSEKISDSSKCNELISHLCKIYKTELHYFYDDKVGQYIQKFLKIKENDLNKEISIFLLNQ